MPGPDAPQTPPSPAEAADAGAGYDAERLTKLAAAAAGTTPEQVAAAREQLARARGEVPAGPTLDDARGALEAELQRLLSMDPDDGWHEALHHTAAALRDTQITLDARAASEPAPLHGSKTPVDLDRVTAAVWQATQAAGAPTHVGDAAVEALRTAIIGPGVL